MLVLRNMGGFYLSFSSSTGEVSGASTKQLLAFWMLQHPHIDLQIYDGKMATLRGLEPLTSSVTGWRTTLLYYKAIL